MTLNKRSISVLTFAALAFAAGCSAHVDGGNVPDPTSLFPKPVASATPTPHPVPTSCQNYAGTYQMNSDYFRLDQTDCSKIDWVWLPTFGQPNEIHELYILDGQPHDIGGGKIRTASIDANGLFNVAATDSKGVAIVSVYSFKKTPCNLANPDGSDYLTDDVTVNGTPAPDSCQFWSKH